MTKLKLIIFLVALIGQTQLQAQTTNSTLDARLLEVKTHLFTDFYPKTPSDLNALDIQSDAATELKLWKQYDELVSQGALDDRNEMDKIDDRNHQEELAKKVNQ